MKRTIVILASLLMLGSLPAATAYVESEETFEHGDDVVTLRASFWWSCWDPEGTDPPRCNPLSSHSASPNWYILGEAFSNDDQECVTPDYTGDWWECTTSGNPTTSCPWGYAKTTDLVWHDSTTTDSEKPYYCP